MKTTEMNFYQFECFEPHLNDQGDLVGNVILFIRESDVAGKRFQFLSPDKEGEQWVNDLDNDVDHDMVSNEQVVAELEQFKLAAQTLPATGDTAEIYASYRNGDGGEDVWSSDEKTS